MERKKIALILLLSIALMSCTLNPFSRCNQVTGNALGTGIGAGIGAGSVWALGGSKTLMGLGGLAGAAIGYYATTLRFASGGVLCAGGRVFTLGDYVTIDIPSDRLFDTNSAEFLTNVRPILDSVATILQRYPNNNIIISGNMSGFNGDRFEQRLSEARARQVAAYLWNNGINDFQYQSLQTRKLTYVGYGSYFPIANTIYNDCIRRNSHIQITAYPTAAQLQIEKCYRVFNNIGECDSDTPCNRRCPPCFGNEFGEVIHEQGNCECAEFMGT